MLDPIKTNMTVLRYRGKRLEHSAIIVAVLLLLTVSIYNIYLGFQNRKEIFQYEQKVAELQRELDSRKTKAEQSTGNLKQDEIESIKRQISRVNRIIAEDVFPWGRLLDTLEKSIPSAVTLNKLTSQNRFRKLLLTGRSTSVDSVTVFLNRLQESELYRTVELANLNLNQPGQVAFNINGRVDMAALLPPAQYGDLWKVLD